MELELHLIVIMPASGSSLCSSLSPELLAHKSSWKTLTLFIDRCREEFHVTRKSCFFASVGWGQCNGLPAFLLSIHRLSVCHSLSISGLVAVPLLYSTLLCMPPLPYREIFFSVSGTSYFTMSPMAHLFFSTSDILCVPSIFPSILVSKSQCMASYLSISSFYHRSSWFVLFSGRQSFQRIDTWNWKISGAEGRILF